MWKAHNLKPFRVRTFKLSRDPKFVENLRDVVGLYLNPPEHALVLCCDEKSQIQALDRTQPGLPRFHIHFIPTSSSWLNLVERRFRNPQSKRFRRTRMSFPRTRESTRLNRRVRQGTQRKRIRRFRRFSQISNREPSTDN